MVFQLTPGQPWTFTPLYSFNSINGRGEYGPYGRLVFDSAGNLYGTTYADGAYGLGSVFKLTPGNPWTYTSLHDFTGGADGAYPFSSVAFDKNGNLYGTASTGGNQGANYPNCLSTGCGVVWKITPQ